MKKVLIITALYVAGLAVSAQAGTINPGESTECKDANSITVQVADIPNQANEKFGYTSNDRGTGSLVVWKSANATTVPLTLGPADDNRSLNAEDHGKTGIGVMGSMGRSKVVLTRQNAFSRGDSIGDIAGLVRFTNTGTNPVSVACN
ncbi:MAG: hypothetical protein KC553_13280 [Nitrospina sp.]|nr:hypothetical protein [Nitrospina sp.]